MRNTLALLLTMAVAGAAWAQEDKAGDEEGRREPAHKIRVLQNPYDIASFYRSSPGPNYFGYQPMPSDLSSRYPIASYYRSQQGGSFGYAPFWAGGYGARRQGLTIGYRRRIGENGELFLFAPTFLAPVGPLAGAFFDR